MSDTPETDDQPIIYAINDNGYQVPCVDIDFARKLEQERDEARELLRILVGLVAYGLGQSGEEWSLDAMRQATAAIQNAKSLEESK